MSAGVLQYAPSGFFVLRTPLLPYEAPSEQGLRDPVIREALHLASSALVEALDSPEQSSPRALHALTAYMVRARTRATPFGLFAGCTMGTVGEGTRLELAPQADYRRRTRLDNDFLFALIAALEADPVVRRVLKWMPNSSLYPLGGRLHYAEASWSGRRRTYHLVAVDRSAHLEATLERASRGATIDELVLSLVDDQVTARMATAFIDELTSAQMLVSDLQLPVTGPEPLTVLIDRLVQQESTRHLAELLENVRVALEKLDAGGMGAAPAEYLRVRRLLDPLPAQPDPARLFQVDMIKPAVRAELGPQVIAEMGHAAQVLLRLTRPSSNDALRRFRERFVERYEDREVSLAEALDEDIGLGFFEGPIYEASPLLRGLNFPPTGDLSEIWIPRDRVLLGMLTGALRDDRDEISLTDDDIASLETADRPAPPDAISVMAVLAAASTQSVDRGDFRLIVRGVDGAPGAGLLGRFCHADDALHQAVKMHLRREEELRPDAVFAEVVHLPEGRMGNILCRPVLRRYEIPYLGRSGAPAETQIPVADLTLSVRNNRFVLRSGRLGCEVVPRMTTAHNADRRTLGMYRFLCALAGDGTVRKTSWDWGPLNGAPYLPRVTYGRLVLSRARWTLHKEQIRQITQRRAEGQLPQLVALADGDNELIADLDSRQSVEMLEAQLKGRTRATLVEALASPQTLCVTGREGRFTHELIVPFVRTSATVKSVTPARRSRIRRDFPPGAEWLYAKLYTGTATADQVLTELVRPVVDQAIGSDAVDSWFFIRYGDPDWHIRLRLHGPRGGLTAEVLPLLHNAAAPLLDDGRLRRLQLDTYQRELERYGGDAGIELSEHLFRHDSEAVLAIVETLPSGTAADARWRLTLAGIDLLLTNLGFDLSQKATWACERRDAFAAEFRANGALGGQIGRRFRTERRGLNELLNGADSTHGLLPGLSILRRRSSGLTPVVHELQRRGLPVAQLAASYAHMHANRLLRSQHRAQEFVIYDLLHRLYNARLHQRQA